MPSALLLLQVTTLADVPKLLFGFKQSPPLFGQRELAMALADAPKLLFGFKQLPPLFGQREMAMAIVPPIFDTVPLIISRKCVGYLYDRPQTASIRKLFHSDIIIHNIIMSLWKVCMCFKKLNNSFHPKTDDYFS